MLRPDYSEKRHSSAKWLRVAIGLAIVGAFLLLYVRDLGDKSLWIDEYSALDFATQGLGGAIRAAAVDVHPPAYFLLLYFWVEAFGQSDLVLRLPSFIFAALGLALTYWLGKKLCGPHVALIAVCFSLVSPFYLLFSHMARYYTMALAASLAATLVLVVALERKRYVYWLAYGMVCALVVYTDYPAVAVVVGHGVYVVGREIAGRIGGSKTGAGPMALRGWLLGAMLGLALYTPWVGVVIGRAMQGSQNRVADYAGGLAGLVLKVGAFVYSFGVGETILPWHPLALLALAAVLVALGLGVTGRREDGRPGAAFLAVLLGVCFLSTILIITLVMPVVTFLNVASRTMFAFPYFSLLVAAGLVRMRGWTWVAVVLIVMANAVSYANYLSGASFLNPIYAVPSKQIAADVEAEVQPGDVVLSTVDSVFERYYDSDLAAVSPHFLVSSWDQARPYIESNGARRVWLITLGLDTNREAYPAEVAGWLRDHYALTASKGYAEQDPTYRWVKEKLLKREAYRYKAVLERFDQK